MNSKEFMGHCYCDTRFTQLREIIANGLLETVLNIQRLNNDRSKGHRHHEIVNLLKERLG